MNYQFKWSVLWTGESGQWLLSGLITTLELSAVAWLIAVVLGIVSGSLRTVRFWPLRTAATFYVEFFRNVPLLVWMFFWYFAVPPLLPDAAQQWLFANGLEFWAAVFALGVYSGARFSEVLRSGIQSIPRTQLEASVALGAHHLPGLPLRHPAGGPADHHPARDQRVPEPAQELVGRAHDQRGRARRSRRGRSRPTPPRRSRRSPRVRSSTWCSASRSPRSCPGSSAAPRFQASSSAGGSGGSPADARSRRHLAESPRF